MGRMSDTHKSCRPQLDLRLRQSPDEIFLFLFNVLRLSYIFQFSIFFLSTTFYQVEVILHSPKLEQKGLDRRYWKSQEEIKQGKMFLWYQVNNLTTNQASLSQPTAVPVIKVMSKENPQHFIGSFKLGRFLESSSLSITSWSALLGPCY